MSAYFPYAYKNTWIVTTKRDNNFIFNTFQDVFNYPISLQYFVSEEREHRQLSVKS